jgi:hypothetical protein
MEIHIKIVSLPSRVSDILLLFIKGEIGHGFQHASNNDSDKNRITSWSILAFSIIWASFLL